MSGRGRGINNKPAWMTRGGDGGPMDNGGLPPGVPGGPPMDNNFGGGPPPGGGPGGGYRGDDRGFGRGPPPPPRRGSYDDRDRGPPRGGGYGGGGRYDDRGPPPPPHHHHHHHHRGGGGRYDDRRDSFRDRGPPPRDFDHRGGGGRHNRDFGDRRGSFERRPNHKNPGTIFFRSYDEEQQWVAERRRKRLARPSKFDVTPTPEQAAADAAMIALSNPAATDFAGINAADRNFTQVPQQTRHARRLYIGQLPPNVTEQELHVFFRNAIEQAVTPDSPGTKNGRLEEDPILSVYINHERRFCFLEFKSVEMTTAAMALDGIDIDGKGKVKVKRPNDYNPAMAPKVAPVSLPKLDTSRLGIISSTVPDGPHKVFVGGLHYHLTEDQVLELLQAFGKVKAFHLVKNDPDSMTSKGYCFVEYADPSVTQVAVMGLSGMDLGGGKMLTARVAGERTGAVAIPPAAIPAAVPAAPAPVPEPAGPGAIPPNANIVHGYDVEALVDAAMGQRPMPTAPMYLDSFGMPLTRLMPTAFVTSAPSPAPPPPPPAAAPPAASALDIANAALAAAYGSPQPQQQQPATPQQQQNGGATRILVLSNMVLQEDLATDEDYQGLQEEVRDECAKYGQLRGMEIPRTVAGNIQPTAILKIFLEYATVQDAQAAQGELQGRKFGDNVVQTSFFSESEYGAGRLA